MGVDSSRPPPTAQHDLKDFLAQPVVHHFMRTSWIGGGFNELTQAKRTELYRVAATWFFLWWLILPCNFLIFLIAAFVPPFEEWYTKWMELENHQTHERLFYGFFFQPCVKFTLHVLADVAIAAQFTSQKIMPYDGSGHHACRVTTGIRASCPVFGSEGTWDFSLVFLYVQVRRLNFP